jgi:hypothetical protein
MVPGNHGAGPNSSSIPSKLRHESAMNQVQASPLSCLGLSSDVLASAEREVARIRRILNETKLLPSKEAIAHIDAMRSVGLIPPRTNLGAIPALQPRSSPVERKVPLHSAHKQDTPSPAPEHSELAQRPNERSQRDSAWVADPVLDNGAVQQHPAPNRFRKDGECWEVSFGGTRQVLRDSVGLQRIHALIRGAGEPISSVKLLGIDSPSLGQPVMDQAARRNVAKRLERIRKAIQPDADPSIVAELKEEEEILQAELSAATGLGGRSRRQGDDFKKASSRFGMSIQRETDALRNKGMSELADHLAEAIDGLFSRTPSYRPSEPAMWDLD